MAKPQRGQWSSWFEFALSCIGSMVGLGNVWRFPYICFKNGGGAFLIPYLIFMVIMAVPLMFMEFAIAQYSSMGPIKIWNCCPLFKGIGYGFFAMTAITSPYYSTIISWTLFYFGNSFFSPLPWSTCDNEWNTKACYHRTFSQRNTTGNASILFNSNLTFSTFDFKDGNNSLTSEKVMNVSTRMTSSEEFWENRVLGLTSSISDIGSVQWHLVLCSLATWTVALLAVVKGIKSSGKFMLLASTLPYIMLTILLVRGLLLPGSLDGIKYFFIPRWKDLLKFSVWSDAATQVFYSASLGIGELITLASHNKWKNNCQSDAIILPTVDMFTSIFAGCVIFSTLGYTSYISNTDIESVVKQGPGIAFMVYPDALATLPLPQIWSALFFFLLFTIGCNSLIVAVQVVTVSVFDSFPHIGSKGRMAITCLFAIGGFLSTIIYTTGGGMYVLQLVDWYLSSIPRVFSVTIECIVFLYLYGVSRISSNIEVMLGRQPAKIWKIMWYFITPPLMTVMFIFMMIEHKPVKYGQNTYPSWSRICGWILAMIPISLIGVGFVRPLLAERGNIFRRIKTAIRPNYAWKASVPTNDEFAFSMNGK